jgi:SOS response regulatory protein OraA/RecX
VTGPDPVAAAARALARRDRSEAGVRALLERKGVAPAEADEALGVLRRAGALDDRRFAATSAEALARRGLGDAAILDRLQREGVDRELAAESVAQLEPEQARAEALVERRGRSARTARWLAARGFEAASVGRALDGIAEIDIPELG